MKQYLMTLINVEANAIIKTGVKSEKDLLGSDYEFLIKKLQENETYAEYGYRKTGADYDYKIMITRVA